MWFHFYINISIMLNDDGTLFYPYFVTKVIWNIKEDTCIKYAFCEYKITFVNMNWHQMGRLIFYPFTVISIHFQNRNLNIASQVKNSCFILLTH